MQQTMNAFSKYCTERLLCVRLFLGAEDTAVSKIVEVPILMGLSGMSRTQKMQVNKMA